MCIQALKEPSLMPGAQFECLLACSILLVIALH
jgi:hypothetical protein